MDVRFVATAFATAFTIIDPIGIIPMTLAATERDSPKRRNQIVNQAVLVASGVFKIPDIDKIPEAVRAKVMGKWE